MGIQTLNKRLDTFLYQRLVDKSAETQGLVLLTSIV